MNLAFKLESFQRVERLICQSVISMHTLRFRQLMAATALVAGWTGSSLGENLPPTPIPQAVPVPETAATTPAGSLGLDGLLKVQQTVQSTLGKVRPAVVAILTHDGTASGVVISEDGLILTAAHVAEEPGRELFVIMEDGKRFRATTLGLDKTTDAALMQLKDKEKKWPFVKVSREVAKTQPGDWCFALGHPGGYDKERGVVLRVGRIVRQTANSLQTDCVLMGGDSGGPLFNMTGEVVGIHSLIWEARDENMHVSMAPFLRAWDDMKSSQVIRVWSTGSGGFLGVATGEGEGGALAVMDVISGSPAEKAGLRSGDIILALNGELMADQPQFSNAVRSRAAGDVVSLRVKSGTEPERTVEVKLGVKPKEEEG